MGNNNNVIIIGASSGLGAGMAREFARRGHDLGLCARRLDRLDALKAELEAAHPGIRVVIRTLDVTDHSQVFAVVRALFSISAGAWADRIGSLRLLAVPTTLFGAGLGCLTLESPVFAYVFFALLGVGPLAGAVAMWRLPRLLDRGG